MNWKKVIFLSLLLAIILGVSAQAKDIAIYVDNTQIETEVPPVLINGRTMVPLRAVCEAMDCQVEWDGENEEITIKHPLMLVRMKINSYYMKATSSRAYTYVYAGDSSKSSRENVTIKMDVPPILLDDRTMVPLRAVAEALPAQVEWDGQNERVLVTKQYAKQGGNTIVRELGEEAGTQAGERHEYDFDANNNITKWRYYGTDGKIKQETSYRYDTNNNCVFVEATNRNGGLVRTEKYTYDEQNRIVGSEYITDSSDYVYDCVYQANTAELKELEICWKDNSFSIIDQPEVASVERNYHLNFETQQVVSWGTFYDKNGDIVDTYGSTQETLTIEKIRNILRSNVVGDLWDVVESQFEL